MAAARWAAMRHPDAARLLIASDSRDLPCTRAHLWKDMLQRLANETVLVVAVCHFPRGMRKWNGISYRLLLLLISVPHFPPLPD